jgi:hypothetical protein
MNPFSDKSVIDEFFLQLMKNIEIIDMKQKALTIINFRIFFIIFLKLFL